MTCEMGINMGIKMGTSYGKGTVSQGPDGRWVGRFEAGHTPQGTRRRLVVRAETEKECRAALNKRRKEYELAKAKGVPYAVDRTNVRQWFERWLPLHEQEVRPGTFRVNSSIARKWILPTLGDTRLSLLTPADVRELHDAMRPHVSSSHTLTAHSILMNSLKAARREGLQVPAAVTEMARPKRGTNTQEALSVQQAIDVLGACETPRQRARWTLALLQGLRQSEVLGLTWSMIDLDAGTLEVSQQLTQISGSATLPANYTPRHLTGSLYLAPPKTAKGKRVMPLAAWTLDALLAWREVWEPNPWDLLFVRPGPLPVLPRFDIVDWQAVQERAGVKHPAGRPFHVHEARHTTATLLLEAGVDPEVIRAIMGHSTIATTRGYQHVSQSLARAAFTAVGDRLQIGR